MHDPRLRCASAVFKSTRQYSTSDSSASCRTCQSARRSLAHALPRARRRAIRQWERSRRRSWHRGALPLRGPSRRLCPDRSLNGFLRAMRTRPSGPGRSRSLASGGRRMYFSSVSRPCSSAGPARVAACRLKPASRTESGASMTTPGRPAKASSRGLRRSSGPAGTRPETAAAASCAKAGSRSASSSETHSTSLSASESRVMTPLLSR